MPQSIADGFPVPMATGSMARLVPSERIPEYHADSSRLSDWGIQRSAAARCRCCMSANPAAARRKGFSGRIRPVSGSRSGARNSAPARPAPHSPSLTVGTKVAKARAVLDRKPMASSMAERFSTSSWASLALSGWLRNLADTGASRHKRRTSTFFRYAACSASSLKSGTASIAMPAAFDNARMRAN